MLVSVQGRESAVCVPTSPPFGPPSPPPPCSLGHHRAPSWAPCVAERLPPAMCFSRQRTHVRPALPPCYAAPWLTVCRALYAADACGNGASVRLRTAGWLSHMTQLLSLYPSLTRCPLSTPTAAPLGTPLRTRAAGQFHLFHLSSFFTEMKGVSLTEGSLAQNSYCQQSSEFTDLRDPGQELKA